MTAFKSWAREPELYKDPPATELYTKLEHLTLTESLASACFACYGFKADHERSWRATVRSIESTWRLYAPSDDAMSAEAVKRRTSLGKRLRKLILSLLAEKAAAYNRFRRSSDVTATHDPSFRSASSPAWALWLEYIEEREKGAKYHRARRIDDDSGSDGEPQPKRRDSGAGDDSSTVKAMKRKSPSSKPQSSSPRRR